jgi:hypothetical protein
MCQTGGFSAIINSKTYLIQYDTEIIGFRYLTQLLHFRVDIAVSFAINVPSLVCRPSILHAPLATPFVTNLI